jgi:ABC-type sugar transport system permease subunit
MADRVGTPVLALRRGLLGTQDRNLWFWAFVGLGNYGDMLSDPAFRSSMVTVVVFAAFIVPTTFALSLGLALLIHRTTWFLPFFRSVFFLPTAC